MLENFRLKIINLPICTSTNSIALRLLKKNNIEEGLLINTDNQVKGKGQKGNIWESEPNKNISFSLILKPSFILSNNIFILNMLISNSILKVLKQYLGIGICVKWPNDFYFDNKKLGGILIENSIHSTKINYCVVGVGINVNQQKFTFKNATSINLETKKTINLKQIRNEIISELSNDYSQAKVKLDKAFIKDIYFKNLFRKENYYFFSQENKVFEAKIIDIDYTGKLILADKKGNLTSYLNKEISFLL